MKMNLTPDLEKPKRSRAKKEVARVELADTASTITRKRESTKKVRAVPPPGLALESSAEREINNYSRNVDPEYGTLINPNNYQETKSRLEALEKSGDITMVEETGTEEPAEAKEILPYTEPMGRVHANEERQTRLEKYPENKIATDRNNRGWFRKALDKFADYLGPKDLYDEDEEDKKINQFTALGRQYEKEQEEKAAKEYHLRHSAPEKPAEKRNPDDYLNDQMAA